MFKLIIFALTWLALATVSRAELPPRPASALPSLTGLKSNERNFLPAEQAFQLVTIANGAEHPHKAQKPEPLPARLMNF